MLFCSDDSELRCGNYVTIRIFSNTYLPVQGQNQKFFPYTGKYRSKKTFILIYFMQCSSLSLIQRKNKGQRKPILGHLLRSVLKKHEKFEVPLKS